jgi:hypothetical protein
MRNHVLLFLRSISSFSLAIIFWSTAAEGGGTKFAGIPISPGATVRADVPLTEQEKSFATDGGNIPPANAVAVIAVPPNFDLLKKWPVLVVFSTSDYRTLNRNDLVNIYRSTALAEGWVVLAGDGPEFARHDSAGWRAGMTLAALDALYRSFPGSIKWPVACAGFSGGAKRAGFIAPMLALAGCRIFGIYLTGINDDLLSPGYRNCRLGADFLKTPVFISSGRSDTVAPFQQQHLVELSIERSGFQRVRQEAFSGFHQVKKSHLVEALRWFRSLQTSP